MVESRVIRIRDSLYVNVPAEEARRLGIREGQVVAFDPRPVRTLGGLWGTLDGRLVHARVPRKELYPDEYAGE